MSHQQPKITADVNRAVTGKPTEITAHAINDQYGSMTVFDEADRPVMKFSEEQYARWVILMGLIGENFHRPDEAAEWVLNQLEIIVKSGISKNVS